MQPWMQYAHQLEDQFGIPRGLYVALIRGESGGRMVTSNAGAIGPAQLLKSTAESLGVDPYNFNQNLLGGAKYFAQQLRAFNNDPRMALAAYNAGPGAVRQYNGVPPYAETRQHGERIMGYWREQRAGKPQVQMSQPQQPMVPQADPTAISNQINRINNAYYESPALAKPHVDKLMSQMEAGISNPSFNNPTNPQAEGAGFFARRAGETGQQYLDRLLMKKFGLQHDPGNHQTTGGQHAIGSDHYRETATDFGNARNSPQLLQQAENWLEQNAGNIVGGLKQALYGENEAEGHGNHLHASTMRSFHKNPSEPVKPPTSRFTKYASTTSRRRPVKSRRVKKNA